MMGNVTSLIPCKDSSYKTSTHKYLIFEQKSLPFSHFLYFPKAITSSIHYDSCKNCLLHFVDWNRVNWAYLYTEVLWHDLPLIYSLINSSFSRLKRLSVSSYSYILISVCTTFPCVT